MTVYLPHRQSHSDFGSGNWFKRVMKKTTADEWSGEGKGEWKQRLMEGRESEEEMGRKEEPRDKLLRFQNRRLICFIGPGSILDRILSEKVVH